MLKFKFGCYSRIGPDPLAAGRGVWTPRDLLWRGVLVFWGGPESCVAT